jgi:hypothetical protein
MKGDFTRFTFNPKKHYSNVLMQQGRVILDADWNEQADIQGNIRETGVADIVGRRGTPVDSAGFKVELAPDGKDLILSSGQMYVDGILCELDCDLEYFGQVTFPSEDRVKLTAPDADCICLKKEQWIELSVEGDLQPQVLKIKEIDTANLILTFNKGVNSDLMEAARIRGIYIKILLKIDAGIVAIDHNYLVYLDLWKRHITAVEDDHIREKALSGLDTTTRTKTEWRAKLIPYDDENILCRDASLKLKDLTDPGDSRLAVRLKTVQKESAKDLCAVISGSAYQGLENQLYRVEVHKPGKIGTATFKWSRNNGAIALAIERKSIESETTDTITDQNKVTVQRLGWDQELRVKIGDLVEVLDDETELKGEHGTLCKVLEIDEAKLQLTLSTKLGEHKPEWHPKLLCWDCNPEQSKELPDQQDFDGFSAKDNWIELENGIEIRFKADDKYQTGDYWLIPARNTGTIEWSYKENDFIPKFGIQHHNCLLAIVNLNKDGKWNIEKDCRKYFQSLADMVILSYAGGDGQKAMPGRDLPDALSLRVFRGGLPLEDAKVQFSVLKGNGQICRSSEKIYEAGPITVTTGEDGIARCLWKFGTDQPEDDLIWNEQVQAVLLYPEQEHPPSILFNASALAASLSYIGGDGQEAMPGQELPAHIQVRVLSSGYPVKSAKVKFEIFKGNGQIRENREKIYEAGPITVTTGEDGIARCLWKFGTDQPENSLIWNEQVQAVLLYPEREHPSSTLFNANALASTLFYVGGDGQEAMPGDWLHAPFEVRVSRGEHPVEEAGIAFEIVDGQGFLDPDPATGPVSTGKDGIARCRCRFKSKDELEGGKLESPYLRVTAKLLDVVSPDESGNASHPSITFNANASVAEKVYYSSEECIQLKGVGTVKDAIDSLCRQVSFTYAGGDGQEAIPEKELPAPFQVRVARGIYPLNNASVRFTIEAGKGQMRREEESNFQNGPLDIQTNKDGIAKCFFKPDESAKILARLIDPKAVDESYISFFAAVSNAENVRYQPSPECKDLPGPMTVKEAIDKLCLGKSSKGRTLKTCVHGNSLQLQKIEKKEGDISLEYDGLAAIITAKSGSSARICFSIPVTSDPNNATKPKAMEAFLQVKANGKMTISSIVISDGGEEALLEINNIAISDKWETIRLAPAIDKPIDKPISFGVGITLFIDNFPLAGNNPAQISISSAGCSIQSNF